MPKIECLLKHGANPLTPDVDGKTALHYAAAKGSVAIHSLLEYGADAMMKDSRGRIALDYLPVEAPTAVRRYLASATLRNTPRDSMFEGIAAEEVERGRSLSDSSIYPLSKDGSRSASKDRSVQETAEKLGYVKLYRPGSV